ncbi:DUF4238 domain-containing protein [Pengzhenrongella sp.]|jgi:hypothetical protein|uniref:DUF4238 domain-containing protein n=1 Tax=Pengzhenrongella sp. TaxID=2888820 RepID=UPI002F945087
MGATTRPFAKRHHTVPRFYLQGFAEKDRIETVRLPGDQRFTQSVSDASVAKNFYAVVGHEDGDDVIERALSQIEGITAAIFKAIIGGTWPLSFDDRMSLGYFVALQVTRVPAQRRSIDHIARQMLRLQVGVGGKSGLRQVLERQGGEVTDERVETLWKQATRPEGPPIERPKAEHIKQMIETAEELVKYIVGRPWSLVRFDQRSLITSDAPVGLVRNPEDEHWFGVGYLTAWGITFPLTRKLGLLMSDPQPLIDQEIPVEEVHEGRADMTQLGTTKLEKFFNYHTVMNASEWLFHHPEDAKFVPDELPEPTLVTVAMSSEDRDFDGEPWFEQHRDA